MRNLLTVALVVGVLSGACSNTPGGVSAGSSGSLGTGGSGAESGTAGSAVSLAAGAGAMNASAGSGAAGTGGATGGAGGAGGASGGAGGATGGSSGSTGGSSEGGISGGGTAGGGALATTSPGCGMALPANVKLGQWTDMADPGNGNPPPIKVDNVDRGYWVYVPANYDKSKPYKVIYQGAGCGTPYTNGNGQSNQSGMTNGSQPVWPFQNADMGQAIQVGLDYGYNPAIPKCFDTNNTQSNDFKFFPVLKSMIEGMFCIDPSHVYLSGHSSGSWWVNQMTCAFGNQIRGTAESTGGEPPLPTCVNGAHIASLFLHDVNDQLNSYQGILPACARALKNNGCTTTTCDPSDATTTQPWAFPASITLPGMGKCIQFKGCPSDSPVVFCTTTNGDPGGQDHYEFVNSFIAPLFWNAFSQY